MKMGRKTHFGIEFAGAESSKGNSPGRDREQEDPGEGAINLDRHPNFEYLAKPQCLCL